VNNYTVGKVQRKEWWRRVIVRREKYDKNNAKLIQNTVAG
jgi:hypothetical protein